MLPKLILFTCLSILNSFQISHLSKSAFCQTYPPLGSHNSLNHPISVPEMHIPWVWEAVHDPMQNYIDVSVITPNACSFNQSRWKELIYRFPQHIEYMGGGLSSNILVSPDCEGSKPFSVSSVLGILGNKVKCVYIGNGRILYRKSSLKVRLHFPSLGPLLIRCPAPSKIEFDSMQLEVKQGVSPFCSEKFGFTSTGYTNATGVFPVCTLPKYDVAHKQYNLSIVSATARADETKMVEWIEYHRLMGVQHFFLYNTAVGVSSAEAINRMLSGYVKEGVVTVIPWHFMNCVRGMATGRTAYYYERSHNGNEVRTFRPPHPIAFYAALMSGYTRFKHTTKFMLYIDDDEFVSLSLIANSSRSEVMGGSSSQSIVPMADSVFSQNPTAAAIYFYPIDMSDCPETDKKHGLSKNTSASFTLPRVGNLLYGSFSGPNLHEHKPLMRTDSVSLFSVHYVALLEANFQDATAAVEAIKFPVERAALLHFKTPHHISGDPFASNLPLPIQRDILESVRCARSHRVVDPYKKGLHGNVNITGHVFPVQLMRKLLENVVNRLKLNRQ